MIIFLEFFFFSSRPLSACHSSLFVCYLYCWDAAIFHFSSSLKTTNKIRRSNKKKTFVFIKLLVMRKIDTQTRGNWERQINGAFCQMKNAMRLSLKTFRSKRLNQTILFDLNTKLTKTRGLFRFIPWRIIAILLICLGKI